MLKGKAYLCVWDRTCFKCKWVHVCPAETNIICYHEDYRSFELKALFTSVQRNKEGCFQRPGPFFNCLSHLSLLLPLLHYHPWHTGLPVVSYNKQPGHLRGRLADWSFIITGLDNSPNCLWNNFCASNLSILLFLAHFANLKTKKCYLKQNSALRCFGQLKVFDRRSFDRLSSVFWRGQLASQIKSLSSHYPFLLNPAEP